MGKRVFNLDKRLKLENYLKRGFTHKQISLALGLSINSIRSEIRRNNVRSANYDANKAQERANNKHSGMIETLKGKYKMIFQIDDIKKLIEENEILKMQIEILENIVKGEHHVNN